MSMEQTIRNIFNIKNFGLKSTVTSTKVQNDS